MLWSKLCLPHLLAIVITNIDRFFQGTLHMTGHHILSGLRQSFSAYAFV